MGRMYDSECLECGEPADHTHPEYPGDVLCDSCFGAYCDEQIDYWVQELGTHIDETDYKPASLSWNLADYSNKVSP